MENELSEAPSFSFWKNLALVTIFFVITPLTLLTSLFSLFSLQSAQATKNEILVSPNYYIRPKTGVRVFASLPTTFPSLSGSAEAADARHEIVRQFLEANRSPLTDYASTLVETADRYELDFRLTTAIAMKESGLCKVIPEGSFNCWGWGIHSEGTLGFSSFEEGIETVSKGLKEEYIDKGYTTPDKIMAKYTPLSQGTWAEGVNYYMAQMQ